MSFIILQLFKFIVLTYKRGIFEYVFNLNTNRYKNKRKATYHLAGRLPILSCNKQNPVSFQTLSHYQLNVYQLKYKNTQYYHNFLMDDYDILKILLTRLPALTNT